MTAHDPLPRCTDPYGGGWVFRVRVESLPGDLLSPAAHAALTEGGDGHGD